MAAKKTKRDKIIDAAMALTAERGWRALTLGDIAKEAKLSFGNLHAEFGSKSAILTAFVRRIDRTVLDGLEAGGADDAPRDRLFDVAMLRFEALAPYKGAIRRMRSGCGIDGRTCAVLMRQLMNSQDWMLSAAGIRTDGWRAARIPALACVFASVMPVWLGEDDPETPKTMAALDKALSRAERAARRHNALARLACRFGAALRPPATPARESEG